MTTRKQWHGMIPTRGQVMKHGLPVKWWTKAGRSAIIRPNYLPAGKPEDTHFPFVPFLFLLFYTRKRYLFRYSAQISHFPFLAFPFLPPLLALFCLLFLLPTDDLLSRID
jgi:hypothetical protein